MACNAAALQNAIPIPLNTCLKITFHIFGIFPDANAKKNFFHSQKPDSFSVYHKLINTQSLVCEQRHKAEEYGLLLNIDSHMLIMVFTRSNS